jgi:opacity protein-like surface antigen
LTNTFFFFIILAIFLKPQFTNSLKSITIMEDVCMKRVLLVLVAMAVLVNVSFAADDVMPAAKAGAKSLNFTFAGLGGFGIGAAGAGGGIGVSYFLNNDAALRLGLNIGTASTTTPAAMIGNSDAKTSTFDVGIGADYLMYSGMGRLRPYMGAGVQITMGSSSSEPSVPTPTPNGTVTKTTNTRANDGLGFSLMGILGAEFWLWNEISLSAEYRPGLIGITQKADSETTVQGQPNVTAKGGSSTNILGLGTTAVMLHIYW